MQLTLGPVGRIVARSTLAVLGLCMLAGCLSQTPATDPPGSPDPGPDADASYAVLLSDCRRVHHTLTTTRETFRPDHPGGVQPYDAVREFVWLDFLECRQAAQGRAIVSNFQLALFADQVRPPNASSESRAWFVFDAHSNSASFVADATEHGLPVRLMEGAAFTTAAPASDTLGSYEFLVPASSAPDYRAEGSIDLVPSRDFGYTEEYFFRSDAGLGLLRMVLEGQEGDNGQGAVEFGPQSYWGSRADVDTWPHVNRYQTQVAGEIRWAPGAPPMRSAT